MKSQRTIETMYPNALHKSLFYNNSKVKFRWDDQSIEWYCKSEKFTCYHRKCIEILKPCIENCNTVLDVGCGVGSFSIEFAKMGYDVTAIDKSHKVIESLCKRADDMNFNNLNALNIPFEDFDFSNKYDMVFVSYMMGLINEESIEKLLHCSNKHLVLILPLNKIKNDFAISELYEKIGIDIKNLEQSNYEDILNTLERKNIKYKIEKISAGFGQPLENAEEALTFIYHYFNISEDDHDEVSDWLKDKLIKIKNLYYLKSIRESAIINIYREDV